MKRFTLLLVILLLPAVASADEKTDKLNALFESCRYNLNVVLMNIVEDAKGQSAKIKDFAEKKCAKQRELADITSQWSRMKDPKFEGCLFAVDAALGNSASDDDQRKRFKTDLCL